MRVQGSYISDYRLDFERGMQRAFIENVKRKTEKNWREIAEEIGISEHTLRHEWRKEKCTIPLSYAKKLSAKAKIDFKNVMDGVKNVLPKNWGQRLGASKIKEKTTKEINIPAKENLKLAEFIGAFLGDGYLFEFGVEFTGEAKLEKNYLNHYLRNIISSLFEIGSTTRIQQNVLRLRCYSKKLSKWLIREFDFELKKKVRSKPRFEKRF